MEAKVETTAGWGVIIMLAAAQFIMVLDTTVMNVSITQVAADLNTTVVGMQTAITVYTLVMAAFMLIGGKLGERWGVKRGYMIGLLVYGAGSLTTALAPSLGVLLIGWSFIEGFGAVLVIPAIAALTAATYTGRQRALAYGILGGVSGASAALGPLIGGWATTYAYYSWRIVFASETVVVLVLMLFLRLIPATQGKQAKLDLVGAFLSAAGLGAAVYGILRSSQWGWITPKAAAPLTPLGLSPVFWLIVIGIVLLGIFARYERRLMAVGREPLMDLNLLQIPSLRAGLTTLLCQQFIIMGTFFVLPLYLQIVLGYDAMETGVRILPLSVGLFAFALVGSSLTGRFSPKRIVLVGLTSMLMGEIMLVGFIEPSLSGAGFYIALLLVGSGLGLLASQLGNVIMSSVAPERGSEAGGLQGTSQNLGASLGTALAGSILIGALVLNFQRVVLADPALADISQDVAAAAEHNANFITSEEVSIKATQAGIPAEQVDAMVANYEASQLAALKASLAGIALFTLIAWWYVWSIPDNVVQVAGVKPQKSPRRSQRMPKTA